VASRTPHRTSRAAQRGPTPAEEPADQSLEEPLDDQEAPAEAAEVAVAPAPARDLTSVDADKLAHRTFEEKWLPRWVPRRLRNSIIELSKVVWPSRQEATNVTIVVIVMAVAFAIFFGLLDLGFFNILQAVINRAA
jgi:preprotein translocase SecE subunit